MSGDLLLPQDADEHIPVALPEPLRLPIVQTARERRHIRRGPPVPPLLDPRRDLLRVGPGLPAQSRGLARERLIQLALTGALENAGDLGQQVGPAVSEIREGIHGGGFLVVAQVAPPRPVTRLAVEFGDEEPVCLRPLIGHVF